MTRARRGHSFGLDVVRCAAILLVLGCHCGLAFTAWTLIEAPAFLRPLGYYGVELFFVLSGFLIGRILLDLAYAVPSVRSWFVFMARRWMRTLPLYFVWLTILATTWPPGLMHRDWATLAAIVPSYVIFAQNLAWAPPDWFTVSWSLSIEEWFYVVFSVTLLVAARLFGPSRATIVVLFMFLAVPLLARLMQPPSVDWNEYLHKAVLFRLDAIAIGVAAAAGVRARAPSPLAAWAMLAAGLVMLFAQCYGYSPIERIAGQRWARAFGFDVTDLGFALLLPSTMMITTPPIWIERPVRLFAAQSYGTYLVHYSLIEWVGFARITTHWSGIVSSLLCAALIVALPAALWHGFEKRLVALRPSALLAYPPADLVEGRRSTSL